MLNAEYITALLNVDVFYFAADSVEQTFLRLDVMRISGVFWRMDNDQEDVRGSRRWLVMEYNEWLCACNWWMSDHDMM